MRLYVPTAFLRLVALTLLLALSLSLAPAAQAQASQLVWSQVPNGEAGVMFEDVFMVGSNLAWAAGHDRDGRLGYVYRLELRNGRWQVSRDATFDEPLYGLAALDNQRVWAVGAGGLIARRTSGGWQTEDSGVPLARLSTIQLLGDGSEAWVLGDRKIGERRIPVALRLRNGFWDTVAIDDPGSDVYINALHLAPGGGWAVGSHIWRLSGDEWRTETQPVVCPELGGVGCVRGYSGVRAIDGERAWAVGSRSGNCGICTNKAYMLGRSRTGWAAPFSDGVPIDLLPAPASNPDTHVLGAVYFSDADHGLAVGNRSYPNTTGGSGPPTSLLFGLRYERGSWRHEPILSGVTASVTGLSMSDPSHALLVGYEGLIASYGYGDQVTPGPDINPATPVPNPNQPGVIYFTPTSHTLRGVFRTYWERYGGLEQFGYPLTEEFSEGGFNVQYFERARFEYHPENAGTRYEVLLGLLGNTLTITRLGEAPFLPAPRSARPGTVYFPETQHNMAPEFVAYWNRYGGLPVYGYPISEPFSEVNPADGKTYIVQYFERNRFEYHPENVGTRYEVLLGLLGRESLRQRGWLK